MIDKNLNLIITLPFDILHVIFDYLDNSDDIRAVAETSRLLANSIMNGANIFWKNKFNEQFPDLVEGRSKAEINWYKEFFQTYDNQYKGLSSYQKDLFSKVKAGKLTSLKNISIKNLLIQDTFGRDLFFWINPTFASEQPALDEIFKESFLTAPDVVNWAIICNQTGYIEQEYNGIPIFISTTPFKLAVKRGNFMLAKWLFEKLKRRSVDLYELIDKNFSPLKLAVRSGNIEFVKYILEKRYYSNSVFLNGTSQQLLHPYEATKAAVSMAIRIKRVDILWRLIQDENLHKTLDYSFFYSKNRDDASSLLARRFFAHPSLPKFHYSNQHIIRKILRFAIEQNDDGTAQIIEHLFLCGLVSEPFLEYLTHAAFHRNTRFIGYIFDLLKKRNKEHVENHIKDFSYEEKPLKQETIDVNEFDGNDFTLLMYAALFGSVQTCQYLISRVEGIDINKQNDLGLTALFIAIYSGNEHVVQCLLEQPDINTALTMQGDHRTNDAKSLYFEKGDTALHIAVKKELPSIVRKLLDKDPGLVAIQNEKGFSPLDYALVLKENTIWTALIQQETKSSFKTVITKRNKEKCNFQEKNVWQKLAFCWKQFVKWFGGKILHHTRKTTILHIEAKKGHVETIKLLMEKEKDPYRLFLEKNGRGETVEEVADPSVKPLIKLEKYLMNNRETNKNSFWSRCNAQNAEKWKAAHTLKNVILNPKRNSLSIENRKMLTGGKLGVIYQELLEQHLISPEEKSEIGYMCLM